MRGLRTLIIILLTGIILSSCDICELTFLGPKEKTYDKVLVMYMAGVNDLSRWLLEDIDELKQGDLPAKDDDKAIVIVCHHPVSYLKYDVKTNPCIIQLYKDKKGLPVLDTLSRLGEDDLLTQKEVMTRSLNYVAETFKSDHYGLILSSHGTGWLPVDYFAHPDKYKVASGGEGSAVAPRVVFPTGLIPFEERAVLPGPAVRSYAEERVKEGGVLYVHEMDLRDLAAAIPFRFDYILMDVCYMGGIEVAYEMKDKAGYIGFSPTEILADGLVYTKITTHLLKNGDPDLKAVLDDYYECYQAQSGDYKSACYTLVDCSKLDILAAACRTAFEDGRAAIAKVSYTKVQRLYRGSHHWFYDLKDILDQAGVDTKAVAQALSQCVVHEIHTEAFMPHSDGFTFRAYCGFSMYLPNHGSTYLNEYYKTLAWNKATSLVQ